MENRLLKERYKLLNGFKSNLKNEKLYLVEDINDSTQKLLKQIHIKEKTSYIDVLEKILAHDYTQLLPAREENTSLKILDFFIDDDLYILLNYEKNKTLKIIKKFPSIGHIMLNRYVIVAGISAGGFGNVYLAGDINLENKLWAIKEMQEEEGEDSDEIKKSFKKESRILSQMDHPSIPRITDFFIQRGKYYMVMDYIQGETISGHIGNLKEDEFIDEDTVINWSLQICDVIDYLHHLETPVIFRDLKPDNIIIAKDGTIKLVDFGIARIFHGTKSQSSRYAYLTQGYAAPEQWMGKAEFSSDVYSLGATIHHIITKVHPQELSPDFPPPSKYNSNISEALDGIVLKTLELKRSDRFSTIQEVKEKLSVLRKKEIKKQHKKSTGKSSEKELMSEADDLRKDEAFEEAIELYEKILELNPNKAIAHYYLGICYDEIGYLEDALENFTLYKENLKDIVKIEKIQKKIDRIKDEIEEEVKRQEEITKQREEKYREFLEIKWMDGVVEIPTIKQVRQRLKIEDDRALQIEEIVKLIVEENIRKEKERDDRTKKSIEKKVDLLALPEKSWGDEPVLPLPEKPRRNETVLPLPEKPRGNEPVKSLQIELPVKKVPELDKKKREDAKKNYYMAVEMAWEDGKIEEYETSYIQKIRNITGISDEDAVKIEKEIKNKLKEKIVAAKEIWLGDNKGEASIKTIELVKSVKSQQKSSFSPDLIEVRKAEQEELKRRDGEAQVILEKELKRKEDACTQYKEEVKSLWDTGSLTENIYSSLIKKRTLLGISDREAMEIEKSIEKTRKEFEEINTVNIDEKKLSKEEEERKKKELSPLTIEGFSMKGIGEGLRASIILREFHGSGLEEIRAFAVVANGIGEYHSITENVSSLAVKTFSKVLLENKDKFSLDPGKSRLLLEELMLETICQILYKAYTDEIPLRINLIAVLIIHNHYIIGNIGNTLACIINKDKIRQLTREHSAQTIGMEKIKEFVSGARKVQPTIFPMNMETFFDIIQGEILFLCDRNFLDIITPEDIRRQIGETDDLKESVQGLVNLAYFIKEGIEDIGIIAIEAGKMPRISSKNIIQYDSSSIPKRRKKTLLDKIKNLFNS